MANLLDKYRPRTFADMVGQAKNVAYLQSFAASPYSVAFLLSGATGTGKTTAAYCLASALGCRLDVQELGGVRELASGEQTAGNVRDVLGWLENIAMYGSGWRVLIVNECDRMRLEAETIWLDALEHLPDRSAVVFTTNDDASLSSRFRDRCERLRFDANTADELQSARELALRVWHGEGRTGNPPLHAPEFCEGSQISYRRLVQSVQRHLAGLVDVPAPSERKAASNPREWRTAKA